MTCRKCAYFDMSLNFAPVGSGESPINFCTKRQTQRCFYDERCEDYVVHDRRKDWSDD